MQVIIEEQGLRDGLQSLPLTVPTETKIRWINMLCDAGIPRIQVASFVHPNKVPQMADAEVLIAALPKRPGTLFSALVLNPKGIERAASSGISHVSASLSASDTHSRKNTGMDQHEAKTAFREMMRLANEADIRVRGGIQCAFGCRYEGKIAKEKILDLVRHHLDLGVDEVALADSTGMGIPVQMHEIGEDLLRICGNTPISLHLHNTENKGYANLIAALDTGINRFDTAFGGLGGCPFIQGATGNIATEDTIHMLHQCGHQTGIDPLAVAAVSREAETVLGTNLPGLLYTLLNRKDIQI